MSGSIRRTGVLGDLKGYTRRQVAVQKSEQVSGFGAKVTENKSRRLCKVRDWPQNSSGPHKATKILTMSTISLRLRVFVRVQ